MPHSIVVVDRRQELLWHATLNLKGTLRGEQLTIASESSNAN